MRWWHWVFTHATAVLLVVSLALGYADWWLLRHPQERVVTVTQEVARVAPGQSRTVSAQVPGGGPQVSERVTAPSATVRVVQVPQPVIVPGPERTRIVAQAPESVTVHLSRACVHPDRPGIPDPTCGRLLVPDLTLVRSGTGYVAVQTPEESQGTSVGPVATTVQGVAEAASPLRYHVAVPFFEVVGAPGGVAAIAGASYANVAYGGVYRIAIGEVYVATAGGAPAAGPGVALTWEHPLF